MLFFHAFGNSRKSIKYFFCGFGDAESLTNIFFAVSGTPEGANNIFFVVAGIPEGPKNDQIVNTLTVIVQNRNVVLTAPQPPKGGAERVQYLTISVLASFILTDTSIW